METAKQFVVYRVQKMPPGHFAPTYYVCAPPGHYRTREGEIVSDGSKGGPEWTWNREHAFLFDTHRKAARVATNGCGIVREA